jgi:hypothetical protein
MAQPENFDLEQHKDKIEDVHYENWLIKNNPLLNADIQEVSGFEEGEKLRRFSYRMTLFEKLYTVHYCITKIKSSSMEDAKDMLVVQLENITIAKKLQQSLIR